VCPQLCGIKQFPHFYRIVSIAFIESKPFSAWSCLTPFLIWFWIKIFYFWMWKIIHFSMLENNLEFCKKIINDDEDIKVSSFIRNIRGAPKIKKWIQGRASFVLRMPTLKLTRFCLTRTKCWQNFISLALLAT